MGVRKQWLKLEGRDFLVEEVPLSPLRQELKALPASEGASLPSRTNTLRQALIRQRPLTQQAAGAPAPAPKLPTLVELTLQFEDQARPTVVLAAPRASSWQLAEPAAPFGAPGN